jgi:hypothetical protein
MAYHDDRRSASLDLSKTVPALLLKLLIANSQGLIYQKYFWGIGHSNCKSQSGDHACGLYPQRHIDEFSQFGKVASITIIHVLM